jgi:3-dehydroquinate synthase
MKVTETIFDNRKVVNYFGADLRLLQELHDPEKIIIITDENIQKLHAADKFADFTVIAVPAGEKIKVQSTADSIIDRLLEMDADKTFLIAGVGGGVITDLAGYVSAIYKRGVKLALVPTTVLAMTDAAIGGKNGVNVGIYKNMVGTTKQVAFLLFDFSFLDTLPRQEWISGFAEIIKHACIKDASLFNELENGSLEKYIADKALMSSLVERNVAIKTDIVVSDEFETGDRYLLNFGHTFGHPIENIYGLPHGNAISLGMVMAGKISEEINNFHSDQQERLVALLEKYELPVKLKADHAAILQLLKKDKKRSGTDINFVLLDEIGKASVAKIPLSQIEDMQNQIL